MYYDFEFSWIMPVKKNVKLKKNTYWDIAKMEEKKLYVPLNHFEPATLTVSKEA